MLRYTVADVCSRAVFTLPVESTLGSVHRAMERLGIRHIPIVDSDHRLVGIISDRDVLRHVNSDGSLSAEKDALPVDSIMNRNPICCRPSDSLNDAAALLMEHSIHCLPLKDAKGVVTGLITNTDLLRTLKMQSWQQARPARLNFMESSLGVDHF